MSSSEIVPADDEINNIKVQGDVDKPRIQGGQDHNSQAQKRRDTVKGVRSIFFIKYVHICQSKDCQNLSGWKGAQADHQTQARFGYFYTVI